MGFQVACTSRWVDCEPTERGQAEAGAAQGEEAGGGEPCILTEALYTAAGHRKESRSYLREDGRSYVVHSVLRTADGRELKCDTFYQRAPRPKPKPTPGTSLRESPPDTQPAPRDATGRHRARLQPAAGAAHAGTALAGTPPPGPPSPPLQPDEGWCQQARALTCYYRLGS